MRRIRCPRGSLCNRTRSTLSGAFSIQSLEQRVMLSLSAGTSGSPVINLLTQSSGQTFFQPISGIPLDLSGQSFIRPNAYTPFNIDLPDLQANLASAPMEFTSSAAEDALVLELPKPDGTLARFHVVEAPIMEPGLAAQLPGVKTFRGQGIDDPSATVRLDYTPLGFHAQVLSPNGAYYIDPYYHIDEDGPYISYFKRDLEPTESWQCFDVDEIEQPSGGSGSLSLVSPSLTSGATLRTYRAAVAGDGEYTAAAGGGTQAGGQAAIVTSMN